MKTRDFSSDEEVESLVTAFEAGRLPAAEFKHSAHIAVGVVYLRETTLEEATEKMRRSLRHFLKINNERGYHETLTVFWMALIEHLVKTRYSNLPLWEQINAIVCSHGGRWPVQAHYSYDLIGSASARDQWIEPDLIPLPLRN